MWAYRLLSFTWNVPFIIRTLLRRVFGSKKEKTELFKEISLEGLPKFGLLLNLSNGLLDETLLSKGVWEKEVTNIICSNLKKGDVFVDVGANIGYYTVLAGLLVGTSGGVIAFEPVSNVFFQLKRNIKINKLNNVSAYMFACGAREKKTRIHVSKRNVGRSSMLDEEREGDIVEEDVEIVRLDDFVDKFKSVNFIKIDAEGYEYEVFLGAINTIKRDLPKIIFEYNPKRMRKLYGGDREAVSLLNSLVDFGYEISDSKGERILDIKKFTQRSIDTGVFADLYCVAT